MRLQRLSGLSPLQRRLLLIVVDAGLLFLSVWLSFWLHLAHPWHPHFGEVGGWMLPAAVLVGFPLFLLTAAAFSGNDDTAELLTDGHGTAKVLQSVGFFTSETTRLKVLSALKQQSSANKKAPL